MQEKVLRSVSEAELNKIMNTMVKPTLKLRSIWDAQYPTVRLHLLHEFMKPAVEIGSFLHQ